MFVTNQSQKNKMKNLIIFLSGLILPILMEMAHQEERLVRLVIMVFHARHAIMLEMEMEQILQQIFLQVDMFLVKHTLLLLQYSKMAFQNLVLNLLLRMKMDRKKELLL